MMTAVALAETADLYDRIAAGYQEWWAPVIAPAALHLLDLVAPTVADRPRARLVDVGAGTGTLARAAVPGAYQSIPTPPRFDLFFGGGALVALAIAVAAVIIIAGAAVARTARTLTLQEVED